MYELLSVLLLLGFLLAFLNPANLLMPDTLNAMLMVGLVVTFLIYIGLVWRERGEDERDLEHIQKSGRVSFFVGATVLVAGIVYQAFSHEIDPFLLLALAIMVTSKLFSRIYHRHKN